MKKARRNRRRINGGKIVMDITTACVMAVIGVFLLATKGTANTVPRTVFADGVIIEEPSPVPPVTTMTTSKPSKTTTTMKKMLCIVNPTIPDNIISTIPTTNTTAVTTMTEITDCDIITSEESITTNVDIIESMRPTMIIGSDGEYHEALNHVTEEERIYLCNAVAVEYGSDWVPLYDKACVVATIMNRVEDGCWVDPGKDSTIYNVLVAENQYNPEYAVPLYNERVTPSVIEAVDYYFENMECFPHYTSFWGDGEYNYFS